MRINPFWTANFLSKTNQYKMKTAGRKSKNSNELKSTVSYWMVYDGFCNTLVLWKVCFLGQFRDPFSSDQNCIVKFIKCLNL